LEQATVAVTIQPIATTPAKTLPCGGLYAATNADEDNAVTALAV